MTAEPDFRSERRLRWYVGEDQKKMACGNTEAAAGK
jgi:hypothetical protein